MSDQDPRDWAPTRFLLHDYQADPQSGAGNCRCGAQRTHRWHPHTFVAAAHRKLVCVCGLRSGHARHQVKS